MTSHRSPRKPFRRCIVALVAVSLLGGAVAPPPASAGVVEYLRDRGEDFLDVFRLRFLVPYRAKGYGAKVRATALLQAGYVHFEGDAYGMDRRAIGHHAEKRTEGGISLAYGTVVEMQKKAGNQYLDPESVWSRAATRGIVRNGGYWDDGRRHPLSFGAELQIGLFGLDLGLYPTEAVDFVAGFLFLDPYKDDRSYTDRIPDYDLAKTEPPTLEPDDSDPRTPYRLPQDEPAYDLSDFGPPLTIEELDATLGSGFVSPTDLRDFHDLEPPPGMETVETPLAP